VVAGKRPAMLAVKGPAPDPLVILLSLMPGDGVVAQHTPREVTFPSPSSVMFPPATAAEELIPVTGLVTRVAITPGLVVKDTSLP